MRRSSLLCAGLCLSCTTSMAAPGVAQAFLDQVQPHADEDIYAFLDVARVSQSFIPGAADIVGAGVFVLGAPYPPVVGTLAISLWDEVPFWGNTRARRITGGRAENVGNGASGAWIDVFWDAIAVEPGRIYAIVVEADVPFAQARSNGWRYRRVEIDGNPLPGPNADFEPDEGRDGAWDLTFRTYSSRSVAPEPASIALLASGLAAVAALRRRRPRAPGSVQSDGTRGRTRADGERRA